MRIEPFELERWQSLFEHEVEINLSDSGVAPLSVRELCDAAELERLLDVPLGYVQTNGTRELRALVAAPYPGAGEREVLVTSGAAEANLLVLWALLEPGDEVVVLLPAYMQLVGLARGLGATVCEWRHEPRLDEGRWRLDLGALEALVGPRTRLVALCNPGNPTGARISGEELDAIVRVAARHGAWVLSDESYRGSELDGRETASAFGRSERVVVTAGLSKAFGLPGLRLGWIVAPAGLCAACWERHDYTTIAPGALSDRLAVRALERRGELLARGRALLRQNLDHVRAFARAHPEALAWIEPEAGAMATFRCATVEGTLELCERLRREASVLVVPGEHFALPGWLRVGFGGGERELREGLARLGALLERAPLQAGKA